MDGSGRLSIRVYTSGAQIPVSEATVVVTSRGENGKMRLISVQTTDSSGGVQPIDIDTPMARESTQPGAAQPPYTVCDVWAEHPGFVMLVVEGVQVFPGVETFQGMELTPLEEGTTSLNQSDMLLIPGQDL